MFAACNYEYRMITDNMGYLLCNLICIDRKYITTQLQRNDVKKNNIMIDLK